MAIKLIVGNLAKLKSGGPWLTVSKDRLEVGSKFLEMSWFDGSRLERAVMAVDTLEAHPSVAIEAAAKVAAKANPAGAPAAE